MRSTPLLRPAAAQPGAVESPRWRYIDSLRGVALAGILFVNTLDITRLGSARLLEGAEPVADPLRDLLYMTAQSRFVPIFTFLFGMSLWFVLTGARARARRPWLVLLRRLAALAGFGVVLGLVYPGNILLEYAIVGTAVLPLILFAPRWAVLGLGVTATVVAFALTGGGNDLATPGMLLTGAGAAAYGLPRVLESGRSWVPVVFGVAAVLTVPALLLQSTSPGDPRFGAWGASAGLVMAVLYVTGLSLLWRTRARRWIAACFEPLGRMALSDYIGAAVLIAAIAAVVDFGRMTSVVPAVALAVAVIVGQSIAGRYWLRCFRYGPAEWLWRTITWWRPVPMRRARAATGR